MAVPVISGGVISGQAALVNMAGWTWEDMAVKQTAAYVLNYPREPSFGFGGGGGRRCARGAATTPPPILGEASIHARNLGRAREIAARMRREAEAVGHRLGMAWADAGDSAIEWLEGGAGKGAVGLRKGAEAMESIPMTYEAAKLRRQLAGRLAEIGDREGALTELTRVYRVFGRLGARPELEKALHQFEEMGAEPQAAR